MNSKLFSPAFWSAIFILIAGAGPIVKTIQAQESNIVSTTIQIQGGNPASGPAEMMPPLEPATAQAPKIDRQELLRQADDLLRMRRAEILKELGCEVDWARYSNAELLDMELRIRKGKEL